ncbi:MAG: multicopper oxidase domain-containing protein [Chryseolinea sp.]
MRAFLLTISLTCIIGISYSQHTHSTEEYSKQRKVPNRNGKAIEYHLNVKDTIVQFTGKRKSAIAINGQIPAPTLYFTEGDTAVIYVHNMLGEEMSIHWHGILLPNDEDGVPYLTTTPIKAGMIHVFKFAIIQTGTFWYHSHTKLQEQLGLYGPLVMYKADETKTGQEVLQLSDWTDIKPKEVLRLLKRNSDWFEIQKDAVQSYGEALVKGQLKDRVKFDWIRMPGADISDVFFPRYLMHGLLQRTFPKYHKNDSIRLRIINGSAATYFWLQFAGGKMKVVAADGNDIKPVDVDKLLIATAETYDVIITLPADGQYELRATAQDIKGYSSAFFGEGQKVNAPDIPSLDYYKTMREMNEMMSKMKKMGMKMTMGLKMRDANMPAPPTNMIKGIEKPVMSMTENMDMKDMSGKKNMMDSMSMKSMMMKKMKMMKTKLTGFDMPPGNGDDKVLSYAMIQSDSVTSLPSDKPWREIHLNLSGNMLRYVWSINGKTLSKLDEKVKIKKGENVRIYFHNATMMEHPMHLHGHFFRVITENEQVSPMKHTFNVNPMAMTIIEFEATEQKDWFLHCHTLYHMAAGMATVISYEGTTSAVQKEYAQGYKRFMKEHGSQTFLWANAMVQSQGIFANATLSGLKWQLNESGNLNWKGSYESETYLRRFLDKRQYWSAYVQTDNRFTQAKEDNDGNIIDYAKHKDLFAIGMAYLLPMFISVDGRVDHTGNFRFQISRRDLPITKRIRLDAVWNTDSEYFLGLRYVVRKNFAFSGNYDSDYGWGAGIDLRY